MNVLILFGICPKINLILALLWWHSFIFIKLYTMDLYFFLHNNQKKVQTFDCNQQSKLYFDLGVSTPLAHVWNIKKIIQIQKTSKKCMELVNVKKPTLKFKITLYIMWVGWDGYHRCASGWKEEKMLWKEEVSDQILSHKETTKCSN